MWTICQLISHSHSNLMRSLNPSIIWWQCKEVKSAKSSIVANCPWYYRLYPNHGAMEIRHSAHLQFNKQIDHQETMTSKRNGNENILKICWFSELFWRLRGTSSLVGSWSTGVIQAVDDCLCQRDGNRAWLNGTVCYPIALGFRVVVIDSQLLCIWP